MQRSKVHFRRDKTGTLPRKIGIVFVQVKGARVESEEPSDFDIPRRNLHQQHVGDAVQEGQFRSGECDLSGGHQVRPEIRGRLLE
jgi:hypothetical protein